MNVKILLRELHSQSVELTLDNGQLIVDGPVSVLTPELEDVLRLHKAEIVQSLESESANAPTIASIPGRGDFARNPSPAKRLLEQAGISVQYIDSPEAAAQAVFELSRTNGTLGLDIEMAKLPGYEQHPQAGLEPHLSRIRLLQLYAGETVVYVFDLHALGTIEYLTPLWARPLIAHNALFELKPEFSRRPGFLNISSGDARR